jgi:pimeloyl-ACP methyl ester carboxylesterase
LEAGVALFEIDGGTLCYEERGEGPPLVFVHGLACAQEDWSDQVSHFAPAYHVVSLDLRGHGRSTGHTSGFDMLTYGADLAALIAHLELPAAVLVGHSMGCKVVLECARSAPEAVAGLVLIDGSRLATADADAVRRNARAAVAAAGYEAFFKRLFTQMFTENSDPELRDSIVARAGRMPEAAGLDLVVEMAAWDARFTEQALSGTKVPVTVLQSTYLNPQRERVSLQPGETTPWLDLAAGLVPQCEIVVVPGVGHFTMIEAADTVNRHIAALLEGVADA